MTEDPHGLETGARKGSQVPADARILALRAAAEAKRLETVEAVRTAIQRLRSSGVEITAKTLADASGRSFRTVLRNEEAHDLYRQNAVYFKKKAGSKKPHVLKPKQSQHIPRIEETRCDPLMDYSKSKLVHRQRALEVRIEELEHELAQVATRQQQVEELNLALRVALQDSNARIIQTVSAEVRKLIPPA